jgi:hypothetical protein
MTIILYNSYLYTQLSDRDERFRCGWKRGGADADHELIHNIFFLFINSHSNARREFAKIQVEDGCRPRLESPERSPAGIWDWFGAEGTRPNDEFL